MVDMSDPGAVEGDESTGVDCAGENVFRDEYTLVPEKDLVAAATSVREVLSFANALEPVIVRVRAVRTL